MQRYVAIDPWQVSNDLCRRIQQKLGANGGTAVESRSEPAQAGGWPDAHLVFTSPPYAMLECYAVGAEGSAARGTEDHQAWRLCRPDGKNKFASHFLVPLMRNAAAATCTFQGRVIININNTPKKAGGSHLTAELKAAAQQAGLCLVETWGMTLSNRVTKKSGGRRAEPIFVFEHEKK